MNSKSNEGNGKMWMVFIISTIITLAILFTYPAYFWLTLPFVFTSFVKVMDWL